MIDLYKVIERGFPLLETHEWEQDKLHISDLGCSCPKQLWLRLHKAESKKPQLSEMLMFDNGQRIHDRMVEILTLGGVRVIDSETPTTLFGLTGRYDCKVKDGKQTVIIDFKSVRGNAFQWLDAKGPKQPNIDQLQGYLMAERANYGILLYVDREGQNGIRYFQVARDDESVMANVSKLKSISDGEMPETLSPVVELKELKTQTTVYTKVPWQCDYCKYYGVSCEGALPGEIKDRQIAGKITDQFYPIDERFEFVKELLNGNIQQG